MLLRAWAPEVIQFDSSAYTPRPIETVVRDITKAGVSPYHPNPGARVTVEHDGTKFHSVTIENAETMFVLQGEDFDFVPGYIQRDFYREYTGFNLNPNLISVPLGRTLGWGASIVKRRFVPDWYFKPGDGNTVMNVLIGWRINQPPTENPFDHLAEAEIHCLFGASYPYVSPEQLALSAA